MTTAGSSREPSRSAMRRGRVVRWFGTNTDITEQRAAEEALREADRHRTEFLAWLSHELRNPLGIIAHQPRPDRARWPRERARSTRGVGHRPAGRANAPSRRRPAGHHAHLDGESPSQTHNRHVERDRPRDGGRLSAAVHARGHQSRRPDHPATAWAPTWTCARIEQIVGNLLQNALKFTAAGGRVALSVRAGKNRHGIIAVRDDGAGLSAGLIGRIFEPLVQDTRTIDRSRGGLGLGLPVRQGARPTARRHGQRLERRTWRRCRVHDSPAA